MMDEWVRTWTYHDQSPFTVSLVFLVFFIISFIPAIVAFARKHRSRWTISVLNVLLGWTVVGWVVTLVWAFSYPGEKARKEPIPADQGQNHP